MNYAENNKKKIKNVIIVNCKSNYLTQTCKKSRKTENPKLSDLGNYFLQSTVYIYIYNRFKNVLQNPKNQSQNALKYIHRTNIRNFDSKLFFQSKQFCRFYPKQRYHKKTRHKKLQFLGPSLNFSP